MGSIACKLSFSPSDRPDMTEIICHPYPDMSSIHLLSIHQSIHPSIHLCHVCSYWEIESTARKKNKASFPFEKQKLIEHIMQKKDGMTNEDVYKEVTVDIEEQ